MADTTLSDQDFLGPKANYRIVSSYGRKYIADRSGNEVFIAVLGSGNKIQYKVYICAEILADSLAFYPILNEGTEIEVNNAILKVNVLKNSN